MCEKITVQYAKLCINVGSQNSVNKDCFITLSRSILQIIVQREFYLYELFSLFLKSVSKMFSFSFIIYIMLPYFLHFSQAKISNNTDSCFCASLQLSLAFNLSSPLLPYHALGRQKKGKLHGRLGGCCPLLSSRCFLSSEALQLFLFGFCFFLLRNYHRTYLQEQLLDFCVQHDILQHNQCYKCNATSFSRLRFCHFSFLCTSFFAVVVPDF